MTSPAEPLHRRAVGAWYRQPVVWLGVLVFAVSMAGCVWIIMVGQRHADTAIDTGGQLLGMPVAARSSPAQP